MGIRIPPNTLVQLRLVVGVVRKNFEKKFVWEFPNIASPDVFSPLGLELSSFSSRKGTCFNLLNDLEPWDLEDVDCFFIPSSGMDSMEWVYKEE